MLRLRDGLRVELLEDEAIVLDPAGEVLHRLTGPAVQAVELLMAGVDPAEVPDDLAQGVDHLVSAGLVADPRKWSRRRFLATGGAVWTAATITSFALADPAAAVTECTGVTPTSLPQMYTTAGAGHMFTTGPAGVGTGMGAMYGLLVRAWGGGGGGGGGAAFLGIGSSATGGGGGAYVRHTALQVTECTAYTVTVGGGGSGTGAFSSSQAGGGAASSFGSLLTANGGVGGQAMGSPPAGGMGGSGGNHSTNGGSGGDDANASGGGGGGGGGEGGNGTNGANGVTGGGAGGAGGAGTPGGGMGGDGAGATMGDNGTAPGGGGGGGSALPTGGGNGAPGAVWVGV